MARLSGRAQQILSAGGAVDVDLPESSVTWEADGTEDGWKPCSPQARRVAAEWEARLAADSAMAVFLAAFDRWIVDPEHQELPTLFRDGLSELASMLSMLSA